MGKANWAAGVLVSLLALAGSGLWAGPTPGRIVFLGDSLTSGYNIQPSLAYPSLIQEKLQKAGYPYQVVNAGVSGDTTAGAKRRLESLIGPDLKLLVLAIGGNDGLRGMDLNQTKSTIDGMIQMTLAHKVPVILAAMEIPSNYGPAYSRQFKAMYTELAQKHKIPLMPFILNGVAMDPDLNLPDMIHPNAAGHKKVAENVWTFLEPQLKSL